MLSFMPASQKSTGKGARHSARTSARVTLFQQMSEVISLREKVAQAELALRALANLEEREDIADPKK
jgi:hypothetical protein